MNKQKIITFVLIIVLTLPTILTPASSVAALDIIPPPSSDVAPGEWQWTGDGSGSEIQMDKVTIPAPTWMRLLTNGLKLAGPARICHEFTGAQHGWSGDIYVLIGNSWIKLATSVEWVPTIEGHLMACALAPAEGTYALFGYWNKPEGYSLPECVDIFITPFYFDDGNGTISLMGARIIPLPDVGTLVKYRIFDIVPQNKLLGDLAGSGTTNISGIANFPGTITYSGEPLWIATLRIETMGCYAEFPISGNPF